MSSFELFKVHCMSLSILTFHVNLLQNIKNFPLNTLFDTLDRQIYVLYVYVVQALHECCVRCVYVQEARAGHYGHPPTRLHLIFMDWVSHWTKSVLSRPVQ